MRLSGYLKARTAADMVGAAENERLARMVAEGERKRPLVEKAIAALDDKVASEVVELYGGLDGGGTLIKAGTRINWNGALKRAAVDLWDVEESAPDNAPGLWEDIAYRGGYRLIPEVITATLAFELGECGWWKDMLYESLLMANTYTPEQYPGGWKLVEVDG